MWGHAWGAAVGPGWSYRSKPSEIPSPTPKLPKPWCGLGYDLPPASSNLLALTCTASSVRPHSFHASGRGDDFKAIDPGKVPQLPCTTRCVGCQRRQEGLNRHGGERGTSGSCTVPHSHHHFPKQVDRRAGAQGTASASVPAKPHGSALM